MSSAPVNKYNEVTVPGFFRPRVFPTNAFSKKWEKLYAMLALYFAWYNFCRVHQTLRVTPAMEAGITDHVWTIEELIGT
jgi:hypothetical protein